MSKPRLKARPVVRKKTEDDWQHCCRWCHYFQGGKCWNKDLFEPMDTFSVYEVSEDGYLAQVLNETLNDEPLIKKFRCDVEKLLDKWNISQKRKKEFEEHFAECWEEFVDVYLKDTLDEKVSTLYQNRLGVSDKFEGIEIQDPSEFSCKEWC